MARIIIDIIVIASMYAVLGAGYVVIYRTSRVLNLALGESFMLAGFFVLFSSVTTGTGLQNIPVAIVLSIILGIVIYYAVLRPVFGQPVIVGILMTAGLSILFRGMSILVWGPEVRGLQPIIGVQNTPHEVLGIFLSTSDIAIISIAVVVLAGLFIFFRLSRLGVQMRAIAENPLLGAYRGINVHLIMAITWGIMACIVSLAGITYGSSVRLEPGIGYMGLKALSVPLVAGMDSLLGVIPAALAIACAEYVAVRWFSPVLGEVAPFIILLIVLMIRPWGLFGTHEEIERV